VVGERLSRAAGGGEREENLRFSGVNAPPPTTSTYSSLPTGGIYNRTAERRDYAVALSNKDREEAFDSGWDAAQQAEEAGEPSLLAGLFGQMLSLPAEAMIDTFLPDKRAEWRQEYERGYHAYQKHSESKARDADARESIEYSESERMSPERNETSTSYHHYDRQEALTQVGGAPSRTFRLVIAIVLIVSAVTAVLVLGRYLELKKTTPALVTIPSYIFPEHRTVLKSWLGRNPEFRVATDADCSCDEDIPAILQNSNNDHLYYAVEDLDSDGDSDFAIVLINLTKHEAGPEFNSALAVFNGPFSGVMNPAFLEEEIGLPVGTVLFRDPAEKQLAVCKWESECSVLLAGRGGYSLELFPGD
jgi:hypothetical protein